jgi:hypothetical protein
MQKLKPITKRSGKITAKIINRAARITNHRYKRYFLPPKQIEISRLKVGDIFLSRNPLSVKSAIGGFLRGGPFTHSFVYLGNGLCLDMRPKGAKISRLDILLQQYGDSFVFRADIENSQRQMLVKELEKMKGAKFNAKVARSGLRNEAIGIKQKQDFEGHHCASIISVAYANVGVPLTKSNPKTMTPNAFMKSKKLRCINC